jgi:hypothetical protein
VVGWAWGLLRPSVLRPGWSVHGPRSRCAQLAWCCMAASFSGLCLGAFACCPWSSTRLNHFHSFAALRCSYGIKGWALEFAHDFDKSTAGPVLGLSKRLGSSGATVAATCDTGKLPTSRG